MTITLLLAPFLLLALSSVGPLVPNVSKVETVYDGAELLSLSDERRINALSQRFERDTGAQVVVPLVDKTSPVYDPSQSLDSGISFDGGWFVSKSSGGGGDTRSW